MAETSKYGNGFFAANTKLGFIAKILLLVDVVLIVAFIVMSIVTITNINNDQWMYWWKGPVPQPFGIAMMVWGAIILALTIITVIWLIKDVKGESKPKPIKAKKNK